MNKYEGFAGSDAAHAEKTARTPALRIDTLQGLAELALPKREYVVTPIIPMRGLAMLYAARESGS
ncbi:MAG: hypothetical protein M3300_06725 [Actinomycetota bacterium]|nr:hypothetical protein [Actinomycetota bacterium]